MDETISLANEIFLVKKIRLKITTLKIVEPSGTNDAAPRSIVDLLLGKKPPTILKTLTEKNTKTALHNELIRDMPKSHFWLIQHDKKKDTKF